MLRDEVYVPVLGNLRECKVMRAFILPMYRADHANLFVYICYHVSIFIVFLFHELIANFIVE
jgi:hypothetical protein